MATRVDDLQRLGRTLVLDELFDLSLYQALHRTARKGNVQRLLAELIPIESRHFAHDGQHRHQGARTVVVSPVAGGVVTVLVSAALAFLSGMNLRRRLITNVVIFASAVALTYAIGLAARSLLGIAVP